MRLGELDDLNAVLREWRGYSNALLWRYSATFRRMVLRLDHRDGGKSMQILALGCRRLAGPVDWLDASLEARVTQEIDPRNGDALLELKDEAAGFHLVCHELSAAIEEWPTLEASLANCDVEDLDDGFGPY